MSSLWRQTAHTYTHINTRRKRSRVPRSPRRPSSTTFLLIVHTDTYHYFSTLCPAHSKERAGAALLRPGGTVGRDHHREQPTTTRTMRSKQSESFAILSPSLAASSLPLNPQPSNRLARLIRGAIAPVHQCSLERAWRGFGLVGKYLTTRQCQPKGGGNKLLNDVQADYLPTAACYRWRVCASV